MAAIYRADGAAKNTNAIVEPDQAVLFRAPALLQWRCYDNLRHAAACGVDTGFSTCGCRSQTLGNIAHIPEAGYNADFIYYRQSDYASAGA